MPYQGIGIPRFYINTMEYLRATRFAPDSWWNTIEEAIAAGPDLFDDTFQLLNYRTIPTDFKESKKKVHPLNIHPDEMTTSEWNLLQSCFGDKVFYATLGHNLQAGFAGAFIAHQGLTGFSGGVNAEALGNSVGKPTIGSGFSIWRSTNLYDGPVSFDLDEDFHCGSFIIGTYYDMPHSPDLKLKMSIEMDGIKNIKTPGGVSLTNIIYTKPPDWGSQGAWQLEGEPNHRHGRRSWDLSFSYLNDSDLMPVNAGTSYALDMNTVVSDLTSGAMSAGDVYQSADGPLEFTSNVVSGTDFFSQVWNKTLGGHLPFIFQPDGDNDSPDQFAICRFDMESLHLTQNMHRRYNCKLKIRECW